jgi:GNAT superfamily N-acetyltransferase
MPIIFRLANKDDIPSISRLFAETKDDIDRRYGFFETRTNPLSQIPLYEFLNRKIPGAFWIGEKDGEVVGFSNSFMRRAFWYLASLFILPNHQGQGLGKKLLEKTLGYWSDQLISNRACTTFAFNPASQFLYMRYGMYAREPVYYAHTLSKKISARLTTPLEYEELGSLDDGWETIRRMDEHALGFSLEWHHEYFSQTHAKCYVFKDHNNSIGYAYVSPNGMVGPVAVLSSESTKPVLETALELSIDQGAENVGFRMPGSNTYAVQLALKCKMRLYPMVLMSNQPFAKWKNYIFHSSALM